MARLPTIGLLTVAALTIAGCASNSQKDAAPLIAMEDFFRNPEMTSFQLSPDGQHISFLQPWQSRLNVHVRRIDSDEVTRITNSTERDIRGYGWANNKRLVYVQDSGGDENFHAFAVNLDGGNFMDLTPFAGIQARFVDILEDDPEHVLVAINDRDPRIHDVHRVDVNTGEREVAAINPGNIMGWQTDNAGKIRVATTTDGVNTSLLYRDTESDEFEVIVTTNFKETVEPLYFTFDDKQLYVASNIGRDKTAIFRYDPKTKEYLDLIYENDEVDVSNLMRSRFKKKVTGVAYVTDKRQYHFFDAEREALQKSLERKLPGVEVVVTSMSRDERHLMVRTFTDRTRGAYYYFNVDSRDLLKLVEVSPWLQADQMAEMKPIKYQSRDGLTINGYLTLPLGIDARNLPVVVNPHGGPWARDYWGFNPEVQFLANRGYAVLQMNFRGSTGYGKDFWTTSFKQWGGTMQDDISDGAEWLIEQGIADPARIGIYGGSYGGYAVLAGLTKTPDLFACGVDYVGVSNIFTWMDAIPPYWEPYREMLYEMVGHPVEERELIESISPIFHADKIAVPLLVAQGANDPRVNKEESDQMVEALRARGIEVSYMVKDNEGHGFGNEENRFDFYGDMEGFFAKHLGGSKEVKPMPDTEG